MCLKMECCHFHSLKQPGYNEEEAVEIKYANNDGQNIEILLFQGT